MKTSHLIKLLQHSIDSFGDLDILADHNIDHAPTTMKLYSVHDINTDSKIEYLTILVDDESFPSRDSIGFYKLVELSFL